MYTKNKCKRVPPPRGEIVPRASYLSKLVRKHFNKAIADEGLFSGQQDILIAIVENEGLTVGDLSKMLGVTKATISVSIKRMEKSGFIDKRPDENDARITRLYPTKKASEAPSRIKEKMDQVDKVITSGMTEEEKLMLSDLLQKAIDNLKKEEKDLD